MSYFNGKLLVHNWVYQFLIKFLVVFQLIIIYNTKEIENDNRYHLKSVL